jgi:predicted nucleic acid-binding protein
MARLVADSSALILLAKCTLLEIICNLFEVIIPSAVTAEVASENLIGAYPDAALISELILKGAIKVQSPRTARFSLSMTLHQGEKEALLLATELKDSLFATDDGKAIKGARFLNVPFIISPKIVVELFKLQKISFKKARESLEKLAKIGRYSPEIIADALISLMEKNNGKADNDKNT